MKRQIAIGTKLLTSVGATIMMLIALAAGGLYTIGGLGNALSESVADGKKMDLAGEMADLIQMMRTNERGMIMFSATNDLAKIGAEASLFEQRASAFSQLIRDIKPFLTSERARQGVGNMEEELPEFVAGRRADPATMRVRESDRGDGDKRRNKPRQQWPLS